MVPRNTVHPANKRKPLVFKVASLNWHNTILVRESPPKSRNRVSDEEMIPVDKGLEESLYSPDTFGKKRMCRVSAQHIYIYI